MDINELKKRYLENEQFERLLAEEGITIIKDFLENWENIKDFHQKYYRNGYPKIVLCGINPGKNGAGKTGIPFLDFDFLSRINPNIKRTDSERSARFFTDIILDIGIEEFYNTFYITNISWVGYLKNKKNINYYQLPPAAKLFVLDMFKYEMFTIQPTAIIALGYSVSDTLKELYSVSKIDVTQQLPHPNFCAFPKKYSECKKMYIELLSKYLK